MFINLSLKLSSFHEDWKTAKLKQSGNKLSVTGPPQYKSNRPIQFIEIEQAKNFATKSL